MIVALVLLALYAWAYRWRWSPAGRAPRRGQVGVFLIGMGMLGTALSGAVDELSHQSFAVHMTQHMLLALVAPPLLVFGLPSRRSDRAPRGGSWLSSPILAALLAAGSLLIWHVPALYLAALGSMPLHILEHAAFFGTAVLFWAVLSRADAQSVVAPVLGLFTLWMASDLLGAALTLSDRAFYPLPVDPAHPWGWAPVQDQRVGGLIMWLGGGIVYAVLMIRWILRGVWAERL